MKNFRIANPKGLFYEMRACSVMTVPVFEYLRDIHVPGITDASKREKYQQALAIVEKLPTMAGFNYLSPQDPNFNPAMTAPRTQYAIVPSKSWVELGSAKGSSGSDSGVECGSAKDAGWDELAQLDKQSGVIEEMLSEIKAASPAFGRSWSPSLKKKHSQALFVAIDDDSEFSKTTAVALFVSTGFLDSKGGRGPLSRSRLFESPAAAGRTAKSHGFSSWEAVEVSISVTKALNLDGSAPQEKMRAAIAKREAEQIDQALEDAGIERLKAKLAELEAAAGMEPSSKEPAKNKQRL